MDYHSMRPHPSERKRMVWESNRNHIWGTKKHPTEQEWELMSLKASSKPYFNRELKAYANFQFMMWTRYGQIDRKDAIEKIPKDLVFYEPNKATRDICWKNMVQYAFVVSPHGNGLDCHRTWESLALGSIPIVKTSGIDSLFDDLPVWIVQDWSEVTTENMKKKMFEFSNKNFNYDKLTLAYWRNILMQNTNATQDS